MKKTIKIVFSTDDYNGGYEIDVATHTFKVCNFDDNSNVIEVIKEDSITDLGFFLQQIQTVLRGAF